MIYDIGGAYDAAAGIFDHHHRGAPLREDGQPYSSFGLIWHHFGRDYLSLSGIPADELEHVHAGFDRSFVLPVDLIDNGAISPSSAGILAGLTLPALLEMRISRDWGSDFARSRALVSRHRGQPFRGRGQADRRLHGVRPDGRGQGVS